MKDVITGLLIAILVMIASSFVENTVSLYFFIICAVICFGVSAIVGKISKYISKDKRSKQFKG
ncbi:dolichol kinase [Paenibacillus sp. RC84]